MRLRFSAIVVLLSVSVACLSPMVAFADQPSASNLQIGIQSEELISNPIKGPDKVVKTVSSGTNYFDLTEFECETYLRYTKVSGSEIIEIDEYGQGSFTDESYKSGGSYECVVDVMAVEAGGYAETHKLVTVIVVMASDPDDAGISSTIAGHGNLTVYWGKSTDCSGYDVQVSTSKSFSSPKKCSVADSDITYACLSGLTSGKRYYARVRTVTKYSGGTLYGNWSTTQSDKILKQTKKTKAEYKRALNRYQKIKKTGEKYGWSVGPLGRGVRAYTSDSETPLTDWYVECANGSFNLNLFMDTSYKTYSGYAYTVDATSDYETVKSVSFLQDAFGADTVHARCYWNLAKGVLTDLKTYSAGYKNPRLLTQTIQLESGKSKVLEMENAKKRVTYDYVAYRPTDKQKIKKLPSSSSVVKSLKKGYKIKRLSNTSFKVTRTKAVDVLAGTIRLKCGKHVYYCSLR